jgi:predicted secreted protein
MLIKRTIAVSIATAVSSLLLATGAVTATASATRVYTHADSGRTVHLKIGTTFKVNLKTCADCGDAWHFTKRPSIGVVRLVSKHVVSHNKPPVVGGFARTIYRFKVVGAGRTTERMVETGPGNGHVVGRFKLTEVTHRAG